MSIERKSATTMRHIFHPKFIGLLTSKYLGLLKEVRYFYIGQQTAYF